MHMVDFQGVRFRISTAFILLGALFFPFVIDLIPYKYSNPFGYDSSISYYWDWFIFHFSPIFFVVAFIFAIYFIAHFLLRKQWRNVMQHILEAITCICFVISMPAY